MAKKRAKEEVVKEEKRGKDNIFGILSLCICILIPLFGLIFGIIAIVRKERSKWMGVTGIIVSVVIWIATVYLLINGIIPSLWTAG